MEECKTIKSERCRKSTKEKKRQLALTNRWLEDNYCVCEGVCIPRCVLYSHYLEFCQTQKLTPACAATFGKIIRQKFPNITTRRLGTRGHSKYHYYGVCIKETSQYYQTVYSARGLTRFSGCKQLNEGGFTKKYSLTSRAGTLLPEFPTSDKLHLPADVNATRLDTLLVMFRTHCQCVLDSIIAGHFVEVSTYLINFWQGMPRHLQSLVGHEVVTYIISCCDMILYNTLIDVLIPATMQEVSDELLLEVRNLAHQWESWISHSMTGLSQSLACSRLSIAQRFAQSLRRQATFIHLTQVARPILYDCDQINLIITEVINVHFEGEDNENKSKSSEGDFLTQFKEVLQKQATIEAFTEWLDAAIDQQVLKQCNGNMKIFKRKAHEFLLVWSRFGSLLLQSFADRQSKNQAAVNLLRVLMDEYVMVAIETQMHEQANRYILCQLQPYIINDRNLINEWRTGSLSLEVQNQTDYLTSANHFNIPQGTLDSSSYTIGYSHDILTPPVSPPDHSSSCRYSNAYSYNPANDFYVTPSTSYNTEIRPYRHQLQGDYYQESYTYNNNGAVMAVDTTPLYSFTNYSTEATWPRNRLDFTPMLYDSSQGFSATANYSQEGRESTDLMTLPSINHIVHGLTNS